MDLFKFRSVFQDISECRTMIIRCLAGSNLVALRQAVGFWLSNKEKRAYLSLVWDVFEHLEWTESTGGVTMMGRGLDFRRVESLFRDATILHWEQLVPFVVMIRAPVCFENLTSWTKQALPDIKYCTKMSVIEADSCDFQCNTMRIASIEGHAAGFNVSVPITVLTQGVPQYQLGTATLDRRAAMSIFQPALDKTNRIAVARIDLNSIEYETANVAAYKTIDTFHIIINGPPFMTNVSLILKSRSEDPRCNWPDNPQVFMRVVNYYALSAPDTEYAAMKMLNARLGW